MSAVCKQLRQQQKFQLYLNKQSHCGKSLLFDSQNQKVCKCNWTRVWSEVAPEMQTSAYQIQHAVRCRNDHIRGTSWSLQYKNISTTDLSSNDVQMLRLKHRETVKDSCNFMDSSAERWRYFTHLLSALSAFVEMLRRLPLWPTFTLLSQTHPASLLTSLTPSVWHMLIGLVKKTLFPEDEEPLG